MAGKYTSLLSCEYYLYGIQSEWLVPKASLLRVVLTYLGEAEGHPNHVKDSLGLIEEDQATPCMVGVEGILLWCGGPVKVIRVAYVFLVIEGFHCLWRFTNVLPS